MSYPLADIYVRFWEIPWEEVIAIHHEGSTSVPGLLAKSIIDIALEIRQYPPSQALIEAVASIGYEHMGESGLRGDLVTQHTDGLWRSKCVHFHSSPSPIVQPADSVE